MTEAAQVSRTPSQQILEYHARSKHHLDRYARGPETLDWSAQPDPFRVFTGSPRTALPLHARSLPTRFADLHDPRGRVPRALTRASAGALLELSLGLSAWKEYGPDRWALRCNPSSGNLHPTEAYLLSAGIPDIDDGVYHYASREHALEQRCRVGWALPSPAAAALWIGLTSIHWREAWKYGERAFRYCLLDSGHALGALRYAAAVLGWHLVVVDACTDAALAGLLGLDRREDFSGAEPETADLLLAVVPVQLSAPGSAQLDAATHLVPQPATQQWQGKASVLDPHPMYHWPLIDQVCVASATPAHARPAARASQLPPCPPLRHAGARSAVDVICGRRSAQHFDHRCSMEETVFFHLLDSVLPRFALPWDVWRLPPQIHLLVFVHSVAGVEPGLYALVRSATAEATLRQALRKDFLWRPLGNAPRHLPLRQLFRGDFRQLAKTLNCHQAIAGDSCFTLAMLASFDSVQSSPWHYRHLYREAGLLGHVLYLEAEAAGLRGTGIGCFFDDALHELLGLRDTRFQSLYHFTVGHALHDARITTLPPYPAPEDPRGAGDRG